MKLRYISLIVVVGVLVSVWIYDYVIYSSYSAVKLNVKVYCVGDGYDSISCNDRIAGVRGLSVQDNDLEESPKLKEALMMALRAEPLADGSRWSSVQMTKTEFEAANQMLVNADPDAAKWYNTDDERYKVDPTKALWPTSQGPGIYIDYNEEVY